MTAADHTPSPATDDPSVFIGSGALLAALHDTYVKHIGMVEPDGPDGPYMWCACGWRSDDLDGNGAVSETPGLSYAVHLSNAQHKAAVKSLQPIVRRVAPSPATDGLREAVQALAADYPMLVARYTEWAAVADGEGSLEEAACYRAEAAVYDREGDRLRAILAAHPAPPSEAATEEVECACESVVGRVDYGTGIEYDVDRSSCPVHADDDDEVYSGCGCTTLCAMGPTCPGGMLAGLPGSGCHRTPSLSSVEETQP